MCFALSLFILGYACSKLLAAALLGSVSGVALVAILASESAALLLTRAAMSEEDEQPPPDLRSTLGALRQSSCSALTQCIACLTFLHASVSVRSACSCILLCA